MTGCLGRPNHEARVFEALQAGVGLFRESQVVQLLA